MSKYNIEYVSTNNNLKTIRVNNFFLHSKYNPIQEAKRIVEKEFEPNFVHVVFGYGLGYIIDELNKKIRKNNKLIVIDPLFKEFKDGVIADNISFTLIEEVKSEVIEKVVAANLDNLSTQVKVICSPNYDKILKEEYLIVLESIKTVQRLHQVGENTARQFSLDWQENYVHNILHSYMNHSLKELKQIYDCPIIVISGGPSLKKQIFKLKEIKDKVITIASGSTINSLLHHGIEPDYIVSIDGGIANYNHFKEIKNIKSQLIYGFSSHYKIQEIFPNGKYAFLDTGDNEFQNYLNNIYNIDVPLIAGGASVANFAFSVACYMTSGPIAIIGQDLAYTDNKSHEDSNKHFIEIDESYKKSRGMFEITGYYNDNVLTDYAFLLMKRDFERLHRQMEHPSHIFNCTEGGAKIEGMEQIPFAEFYDSFIKGETNVKLNIQIKPKSKDSDFFIEKMQAEIAIYNKIIGEIQIGLAKLNSNKSNIVFEKSVLRELDKIDKSIKKYKTMTAMNHIFDPITMDVLRNYEPVPNESDRAAFERVFNQNKELYSRLLEAFKVSKQYVLDVIKTPIK